MKLLKILVIFLFLLIATLPAFSQEEKITVNAGDDFKIELPSNMSTGYCWQLAKPIDKEIIELVSSGYFRTNPMLIGSGGKEVWVFKALKEGQTNITLKYIHPWEDESIPPADFKTYFTEVKKE